MSRDHMEVIHALSFWSAADDISSYIEREIESCKPGDISVLLYRGMRLALDRMIDSIKESEITVPKGVEVEPGTY